MTDLFTLLRRIQAEGRDFRVEPADRAFIDQYLAEPETFIQFKAKKVGGTPEEPIFAQDYAIKGTDDDIINLLVEAMIQNPAFAFIVHSCAQAYRHHVLECPRCAEAQAGALALIRKGINYWEFKPHS